MAEDAQNPLLSHMHEQLATFRAELGSLMDAGRGAAERNDRVAALAILNQHVSWHLLAAIGMVMGAVVALRDNDLDAVQRIAEVLVKYGITLRQGSTQAIRAIAETDTNKRDPVEVAQTALDAMDAKLDGVKSFLPSLGA